MARSVLLVAAHSDDEALGCGGTLARHARDGDQVHLIFLTDGVGARKQSTKDEDAEYRGAACEKAAGILGVASVKQFSFPDNQMDGVPLIAIVQKIEEYATELCPQIVYTHHAGDLNVDHQLCNRAVLTAFRPSPGQTVRSIYSFEVPSATGWNPGADSGFRPQRFVDISSTLEIKERALRAYDEEMRNFPHARSYDALVALARWRGASVGVPAAEAFAVLREII